MAMVDQGYVWSGFTTAALNIKDNDVECFDIRKPPFKVYGLWNPQVNYRRLPDDVAESISGGVAEKATAPAGGRVRFATDSPSVGIRVKFRYRLVGEPHQTRLGDTGFDLYVEEDGRDRFQYSFLPSMDVFEGYEGINSVGEKKMREYTLHFPVLNEVYSVEIVLKKGSVLKEHRAYRNEKPIAFYGSSITHGCSVSRPGNVYSNIIARHLDTDILCLGFSGQAKGEPNMAKYIAGLDLSAFVLDYDHNASSTEYLAETHEPFYRIVRKAQPNLPIVMVTRPAAKITEIALQNKDVIMRTYLNARVDGDKNVYFIDGYSLFSGTDRTECTVDGTHPNDFGSMRMANVIGEVLKDVLYHN